MQIQLGTLAAIVEAGQVISQIYPNTGSCAHVRDGLAGLSDDHLMKLSRAIDTLCTGVRSIAVQDVIVNELNRRVVTP